MELQTLAQANFSRVVGDLYNSRSNYDEEPETWHPTVAKALVDRVSIRPDHFVLDVATGTGLVARHIAPRLFSGGKVIAIDNSSTMLRQLEAKINEANIENVVVECKDAHALKFEPETFDLIFCCEALQILKNSPQLLVSWRKWLRPGGTVGFTAYSKDSASLPIYAKAYEDVTHKKAPPNMFEGLGSEEKCIQALSDAGFVDIAVKTEHTFHRTNPNAAPTDHDFLRFAFLGHSDIEALSSEQIKSIDSAAKMAFNERTSSVGYFERMKRFYVTGHANEVINSSQMSSN